MHFGETLIHAPSWGALRVARRTSWGPHPASLPLPAGLAGRPVLRLQDLGAGRPPPPVRPPRPPAPTSPRLPSCRLGSEAGPAALSGGAPTPPALRPPPTPGFSSLIAFYIVATRHTLRTIYHFYYF